jgi:hypothetical protein
MLLITLLTGQATMTEDTQYILMGIGLVFLGLITFELKINKIMKVRDRQFRILLARLNELSNRQIDDYSSKLNDEEE